MQSDEVGLVEDGEDCHSEEHGLKADWVGVLVFAAIEAEELGELLKVLLVGESVFDDVPERPFLHAKLYLL